MSIYPSSNIINRIYGHCNNMRPNVVLNINNGILKLVLESNNGFNCICISDPKDLIDIYSLFNIDLYLVSDYIQHSQHRTVHQKCHVKELLFLVDPPSPLLKREDLMLLSERLDDTYKLTIGPEKINSSWSFLSRNEYILPGIPTHKINEGRRGEVCVLHDNSSSTQKLCHILAQKYPDLKTISKFDNYKSTMELLNSYKVCLNLNSSIDSLYALYAGCSVISRTQTYEHEQAYENIDHMLELITRELSIFNIIERRDVHNILATQYNNEIFTDSISKLISKYTKEPFYI